MVHRNNQAVVAHTLEAAYLEVAALGGLGLGGPDEEVVVHTVDTAEEETAAGLESQDVVVAVACHILALVGIGRVGVADEFAADLADEEAAAEFADLEAVG